MKPNDGKHNPYSSPEEYDLPPKEFIDAELVPAPCPRCGSSSGRPAPYNSTHGRRSPVAIKHVICGNCRCEYDGITRLEYPARKSPAVWIVLAVIGVVLYFMLVVFAGTL